MAESNQNNSNSASSPKDKIWYDPEEYAIRKRLPQNLPRRNIDIYISNKTDFKVQLERCRQFIEKGESEFYIHSLGSAISTALSLALQIQKDNTKIVNLETITSTLELTEDFESTANHESHRYNSAVHIKYQNKNKKPTKLFLKKEGKNQCLKEKCFSN